MIFDQQLKITFRKSSGPLKKSTPPFLLTPPPPPPPRKLQKVQVPSFLPTFKIFQLLPWQKGGGGHRGNTPRHI